MQPEEFPKDIPSSGKAPGVRWRMYPHTCSAVAWVAVGWVGNGECGFDDYYYYYYYYHYYC